MDYFIPGCIFDDKIYSASCETLLFLDEIQESNRVIASLRYFYEDFPELHVIAAGSLLEFALNELPSFAVGRVRSLYMYPFSFDEFLSAHGLDMQVHFKHKADSFQPFPEVLHQQMIALLRIFYPTGGEPQIKKSVPISPISVISVHFSLFIFRFSLLIPFTLFRTVLNQINPIFVRNTKFLNGKY